MAAYDCTKIRLEVGGIGYHYYVYCVILVANISVANWSQSYPVGYAAALSLHYLFFRNLFACQNFHMTFISSMLADFFVCQTL